MRFDVARLARRILVLVVVSGLPALAVTAPSGWPSTANAAGHAATSAFEGIRLENVASRVGLDFRQGAFRFGVSPDPAAMTGGGLCALDYNNDGWVDLFVVNSYSQADIDRWHKRGGLPRSALFRNTRGRFRNVTRSSGAGLAVKGQGCVAADFNGDGHIDLFITADGRNKLLWNNGNGTFTEGAVAAGIRSFGWHTGAAVADVNSDGRPDLFVAGYTDVNLPVSGSAAGFPNNFAGVRDLLYLNMGRDKHGHSRFREVGVQAGLEAARFDHSLGAVFSDFDGDGRPDLYVANDGDPNRLYQNIAWPGGRKADPAGLGFRFEERAAIAGVADPNAGMGVAAADFNGDGHTDLFVSNSRGQPHAVYTGQQPLASGRRSPTFEQRSNRLWQDVHRLGRILGRPRPGRQSRPGADERRNPGDQSRAGRAADSGAREHGRTPGSPPGSRTGPHSSAVTTSPGSSAAASRRPTSTTTARWTSPSTRSAGSWSSCVRREPSAHGLRCASPGSLPGRS